ncbi:MAG: helix-turn-helix transcriptional regulator [Bacillota bacterium]|nr:helix-turn-helix transcriptional regulator [Bacillota bacterium]
MWITYKKLRNILDLADMQLKELHHGAGISNDAIAKINKDEYISMKNLEKIARYLKKNIGDIIELK